MNVVIRTDASLTIGTGHVMRSLTLANSLHERSAEVSFVCREHDGNLCNMIEGRGFPVVRLAPPKAGNQAEKFPTHASWLGAAWQEDSEQTRAAIGDGNADWLVVDHYALDRRWESSLRPSVGRIMAIDDLADREHDCDLLLDQNVVAKMYTRYAEKVPAACSLLLGPEYALLQRNYSELHDRVLPREGPIRRILIFFGGVDRENLSGRTLAAFLQLNRPDIEIDVVMTANSPHAESIRRQVSGHDNIRLFSGLPTLAPLMAKADLAIGAGGATSWERLCLGLPSLVVSLADNQRPIAEELDRRGLIWWLGHVDEIDDAAISKALGRLMNQVLERDWSLRCRAAIDGNGADRVCDVMITSHHFALHVRNAGFEDEALLLKWANDPTTRRNGFSSGPISPETHNRWLGKRLQDRENCHLCIVETTDGVPVGQVRFERADQAWEIHYSLAPEFRGRGLGRPLLDAAMCKLRSEVRDAAVFGKVKGDNYPSRRVFELLGFQSRTDSEGAAIYRRIL